MGSICSATSSCLYDRLWGTQFDALGLGVRSGPLPSIFGLRATSILLILLSFSKMEFSMIWELTLVRSTGILPNFLFESFVPPIESYYKLVSEFSFIGTPSLPLYWVIILGLFVGLLGLVFICTFCNFLALSTPTTSVEGIITFELLINVFFDVNSKFRMPSIV